MLVLWILGFMLVGGAMGVGLARMSYAWARVLPAPRPRIASPEGDATKVRRWVPKLAATALVVAVPVAAWSWLGELREPGCGDYLLKVPAVDRGTEQAVAAGVTAVALASVVILAISSWRKRVNVRCAVVLLPLIAAGLVLGHGGRVVTACAGGANIGGGIVILVFAPMAVGLIVGAVLNWASLKRAGRPSEEAAHARAGS